MTRASPNDDSDVAAALDLFERIPDDPLIAFVAFRKCNGRAYCHWQLGDVERGIEYARLAERHAGDGGFVRFRVMALNLLARMLSGEEASAVRERAERMSRFVEDEDLLCRVRGRW